MPGPVAVSSAMLQCSFGMAPGTLVAMPTRRVMAEGKPIAAVTDIMFPTNITGFAMCQSLANPAVAAATSAAAGVLTPQACTPVVAGPWTPGAPKTLVGGVPALTAGSTCTCVFGGVINLVNPVCVKTQAS